MGKHYTELLADIAGLQLPLPRTDFAENIYWVYGIVLKDEVKLEVQEVMARCAEYKIGTRPFFWPMHEQPVLQKMGLFQGESYPNAEHLARRGFYIPSGMALRKDQREEVAKTLKTILQ